MTVAVAAAAAPMNLVGEGGYQIGNTYNSSQNVFTLSPKSVVNKKLCNLLGKDWQYIIERINVTIMCRNDELS